MEVALPDEAVLLLVGWLGSETTPPVDEELGTWTGCDRAELEGGDECAALAVDARLDTGWVVTGYVGDDA